MPSFGVVRMAKIDVVHMGLDQEAQEARKEIADGG